MRALVVFESMFGNTRDIAQAVAEGLRDGFEVELGDCGTVSPTLSGPIDLLVIGGPTHAFGMSRPGTRQSAVGQGAAENAARLGVREWIADLEASLGPRSVAVFDTRIDKPRLPGSAARSAAKKLRAIGFTPVVSPESFFVVGTPGPLLEGEIDRARRWGAALAALAPLPAAREA